MKGNRGASGTNLPGRKNRPRMLLYGIIMLIVGIVLVVFMASFDSPYASCGYDFFCEPRLKTSGEIFTQYALPVFLIIVGILDIIVWLLTSSYVRDRAQQQRRTGEEKYDLEDDFESSKD